MSKIGRVSTRRAVLQGGAAMSALSLASVISSRGRAAEFVFKYGNQVPANHPMSVFAHKAADRIAEESKGRLEIRLFPNNQLGGDTDMLSQLRSGALELFTISPVVLSNLVSVASISGVGFAFPTAEAAWTAMDGELGSYVRAQIAKFGLTAMPKIWDSGFRQITTSQKPIASAGDLKGLKIRVPVTPLWASMFKAFGAAPAPINFSELYSALQTKIVDGQETPLVSIQAAKLYEVQKYCALTNHVWDGYWLIANTKAFEQLPADLREIATRNFDRAAAEQRVENRRLNDSLQGDLEKAGLVFNKPDPASFRAALTHGGFYGEWRGKFGNAAWELLQKYSGELA
jgi:tripartite ATP-independent transporter DctP family solute receptor